MSDKIPSRKLDIGSDGNQYWEVDVKVNKSLWGCLGFEEKREIRLFVDGVQEKINCAMDLALGRRISDELSKEPVKTEGVKNEGKSSPEAKKREA